MLQYSNNSGSNFHVLFVIIVTVLFDIATYFCDMLSYCMVAQQANKGEEC